MLRYTSPLFILLFVAAAVGQEETPLLGLPSAEETQDATAWSYIRPVLLYLIPLIGTGLLTWFTAHWQFRHKQAEKTIDASVEVEKKNIDAETERQSLSGDQRLKEVELKLQEQSALYEECRTLRDELKLARSEEEERLKKIDTLISENAQLKAENDSLRGTIDNMRERIRVLEEAIKQGADSSSLPLSDSLRARIDNADEGDI